MDAQILDRTGETWRVTSDMYGALLIKVLEMDSLVKAEIIEHRCQEFVGLTVRLDPSFLTWRELVILPYDPNGEKVLDELFGEADPDYVPPTRFWGERQYETVGEGESNGVWFRESLVYPDLTLVSDENGLASRLELSDRVKEQGKGEGDDAYYVRMALLDALPVRYVEGGLSEAMAECLGLVTR